MEERKLDERDLQLCTFKIGDNFYAISVFDIQEIIKPQRITVVPLIDDDVRGLVNLRGQIVTSISLRNLLGLEDHLTKKFMNVVVRRGDDLFSLVVDDVLDVVDLEESMFEDTSSVLDEKIRGFIKGVFKLEDRLLIYLDLEVLLETQQVNRGIDG